jgi:valyl-tRNA synthetase
MSKSRGNVVDPLAWIETYGADAVRFTLARGANPGTDQAIAEDWVRGAKSFCSKLFNATRFALLNGARVPDTPVDPDAGSAADRWITDRLDAVVAETTALLADFQFAKAAEGLYHFAWDEFCDWYVELAKAPLQAGGAAADHTRAVLGTVLDTLLRLLHPFVPFVTESLWTQLTAGETLVIADWPQPSGHTDDPDAASQIADTIKLVTEIRRFRADQGLPPGRKVPARIGRDGDGRGSGTDGFVTDNALALGRLVTADDSFVPTAALDVALSTGTVTVRIDTSEAIDVAAETARAQRDLADARAELAKTAGKLDNPAFLAKAPEHVVAKIRARHDAATEEIDRLTARLAGLGGSADGSA